CARERLYLTAGDSSSIAYGMGSW
nr:immunoglobulin heavy chain junction region [Macaca mulatta]